MKMAKEQGMSLNTNKISGVCGKLMCCIGYEHEIYQELKKEVPNVGQLVKTPNCPCCKVVSVDYVKKIVSVQENQDGAPVRYEANKVSLVLPKDPNQKDAELVVSNEDLLEDQVEELIEENVQETQEDKSKKKIYKPFVKANKNNKKKNNKHEHKK
jgi:cell fate regulator YaaT (PSP1 superfamily)